MGLKVMMFVLLVILQGEIPPTATPGPRYVTVTLTDADGNPVAGQLMQLVIRQPLVRQECTSNEAGFCQFDFIAGGDLLEGYVLLVGRGQRTVTWKGVGVDIGIQLSASGALEIPYDFTGPPAPPIQTAIAATATTMAATAEALNETQSASSVLPTADDAIPVLDASIPDLVKTEAAPNPTTAVIGANTTDPTSIDDAAATDTAVPISNPVGFGLLDFVALSLAGLVMALIGAVVWQTWQRHKEQAAGAAKDRGDHE